MESIPEIRPLFPALAFEFFREELLCANDHHVLLRFQPGFDEPPVGQGMLQFYFLPHEGVLPCLHVEKGLALVPDDRFSRGYHAAIRLTRKRKPAAYQGTGRGRICLDQKEVSSALKLRVSRGSRPHIKRLGDILFSG